MRGLNYQPESLSVGKSGIESLTRIERAERRLWKLALLVLLLFSLSLALLQCVRPPGEGFAGRVTDRMQALREAYGLALALALATLFIIAYLRRGLMEVRAQNRSLVTTLAENARLLAYRNRQLQTWDELSHEMVTNSDLPRLLRFIVETAAAVTESDGAAILTTAHGGHHYQLAALFGQGAQTEFARRVALKAIQTKQCLRIHPPGIPAEFNRSDVPPDGIADVIATPVTAGGAIDGALIVVRLTPHSIYPDRVEEELASFTVQASLALQQAALHASYQQQLSWRGNQPYSEAVTHNAHEALGQ